MGMKQTLPIGMDDFRELREGNFYYVDKTLLIKDFIELRNKVSLIARPRRFGKTLNMTMLRDFFSITQDSREIFKRLNIMDTEYAGQINSKPVIYLTMKDCKAVNASELLILIKESLYREFLRYEQLWHDKLDTASFEVKDFYGMIEVLRERDTSPALFSTAIRKLTEFVKNRYGIPPILLIDEYDQPIMSSYERGYHDQLGDFFSNLYGSAMKSNPFLGQALLTGVQRVAKESIFSQFNNVMVYTVLQEQYASYFGLTADETARLLADYDIPFDEAVQKKYNGYRFGEIQMYNPWSILNYVDTGRLSNYWVKTSSNTLIRDALTNANQTFWDKFDQLVLGAAITVSLTLDTSYLERDSNYSLWGLLVNSGYLTVLQEIDDNTAIVKIPNEEVLSEFQVLIAEMSGIEALDLREMFSCLRKKNMDGFIAIYRKIVVSCTSFMDALPSEGWLPENAYHMLFLGMCMTLRGAYEVKSNMESGHGRSDIMLKSLHPGHSHMIIEFKRGEEKELEKLAREALKQIKEKEYYAPLAGDVICIGLAHDRKRCRMVHEIIKN